MLTLNQKHKNMIPITSTETIGSLVYFMMLLKFLVASCLKIELISWIEKSSMFSVISVNEPLITGTLIPQPQLPT